MTLVKIQSESLVHGTNLLQQRLKHWPPVETAQRLLRLAQVPLKLH